MQLEGEALRRSRLKFIGLFLICLAPVVASYVMYYMTPPEGRTNYGRLVQPQVPVIELQAIAPDGKPWPLTALRGKWWFVQIDASACEQACQDKLYWMRQVRLTTGRDRDRIERLWLQTDAGAVSADLLQQHEGLQRAVLTPELTAAMRTAVQRAYGNEAVLTDHVVMIDPLGNIMMVQPKNADPNRVKKDVTKLLKASRIG